MGDEENGLLRLQGDLDEFFLHGLARLRVERGKGLIHEQQLRVHHECASQIDALLHATGQFVRKMLLEADEPDHVDEIHRPVARFAPGPTLTFEPVHHIAQNRAPGQQRSILKYDRAIGAGLRDPRAIDDDLARRRTQQSVDDGQERRLAAARRTDDRHELALVDGQADILKCNEARIGARLKIGKPDTAGLKLNVQRRFPSGLFLKPITSARTCEPPVRRLWRLRARSQPRPRWCKASRAS